MTAKAALKGEAMDLAVVAKRTFVMMEHLAKGGDSKIVERCSYPLTGVGCVSRIYTDLAVIDVTPRGLVVVEAVRGLEIEELQRLTAALLL
jgi:3-oxoadipate CoA-transferase, beta subunit